MREPARLFDPTEDFLAAVRRGLRLPGQKELPSAYLYDAVGSALFDVICLLPEYGLSRAGTRLLKAHAAEIAARVAPPTVVAELGSGTGRKTRLFLSALKPPVTYYPIDVSESALEDCRREVAEIDSLLCVGLHAHYLDGLRQAAGRRRPGERVLVLFLGSSIGNFDRGQAAEFLAQVRDLLAPADLLLLGTDLEKPVEALLLAYDDPIGVTAAFNLNLLARVNRELEGDFDLRRFRHWARWNDKERRIEMHLVATERQTARIARAGLELTLAAGETIWTESSHKFRRDEANQMCQAAGFHPLAQWVDEEWPFALSLFAA